MTTFGLHWVRSALIRASENHELIKKKEKMKRMHSKNFLYNLWVASQLGDKNNETNPDPYPKTGRTIEMKMKRNRNKTV